ncbi:hypothetical protein F7725_025582 [Dissostichus mawsoni]|uniref:Uncharacterized protein n=1 Tax=Dissostichus mawsoni TaxID=36200 RepID=A0A7J5XDM8_DISMA|nr:hypothetical protein F7725_025582 [Dissostichus mawsoni]
MHPSVNTSSSGAASRAEIKPGVLLLCLEDVQSQRAALHFPLVPKRLTAALKDTVGNQAVLPCSWKQRLGEVAPSACYIQWNSPADTVFELQGEKKWQAEEFQGRMEVPEEKLKSGDCSLVISDVQIGDTGRYESFMVVDGVRSAKTKVFIQNYESILSRVPGEDLVLDLYTQHSVKVVFQGRNSSEWSVVWMRGEEDSERMEQDVANEQLTIKNLKSSDEGMYKVMDEQGLGVSTVLLSVNEDSKAFKLAQTMDNRVVQVDELRADGQAPEAGLVQTLWKPASASFTKAIIPPKGGDRISSINSWRDSGSHSFSKCEHLERFDS